MSQFPIQSGVSFLLSAMLLISSIASLGVRHAHTEGDRPHSHHGDLRSDQHEHDGHNHVEAACSNESVHHDRQSTCELLAGMVSHIHLTLFGYQLSLPAQHTPDEDEIPTDISVVGIFNESYTSPTSQHPSELFRVLSAIVALDDVARFDRVIAGFPHVTSQPLCDSARLERSGVRLI
jgi:hypothetical protein